MPLICKDMVDLLDTSNTSAMNHSSLSNYAFLYGVFPTAPSVGIYAVYYNAELQVVSLYLYSYHLTARGGYQHRANNTICKSLVCNI